MLPSRPPTFSLTPVWDFLTQYFTRCWEEREVTASRESRAGDRPGRTGEAGEALMVARAVLSVLSLHGAVCSPLPPRLSSPGCTSQ